MDINDKTVWITGASSGIGEACAVAFAQKGASLILSARNEEKLQKVKSKCAGAKDVFILPMDVSEHNSLGEKTKTAISKTGKVDILINNAGISQRGSVSESDLAIDKRIFDVNFFGNIGLTRELLPYMKQNKSGAIVVISSIVGKLSTPKRSAYSASKHALHGWYDALRAEETKNGIQVNIICPGYITTDISINALKADGSEHGVMDDGQAKGMPASKCAKHIINAIRRNKNETFIGGKELYGLTLRKYLPGAYYRMIEKMAHK